MSAVSHSLVSALEDLLSHVGADSDAVAKLPAHSACLAVLGFRGLGNISGADGTVIKSATDIADKRTDLGSSGSHDTRAV